MLEAQKRKQDPSLPLVRAGIVGSYYSSNGEGNFPKSILHETVFSNLCTSVYVHDNKINIRGSPFDPVALWGVAGLATRSQ